MSRHKQQGMTFLGWVIVLAIIGIFALTAIRLTPVYLEFMKVSSAMEGTRDALSGTEDATPRGIRSALGKRFNIEAVSVIKSADVEVARSDNGLTVTADYSHVVPFIANVSFKVDFNKSVEITK